ncbi:hypothetical protein ACIGAN_27065 [Streptomyces sp. NPDC085931]|uniref:hypothetical protein n=1 Tax=Streptomyces sp. NPDC085931 TaxID=3365740 RepID=UPI0037D676B7
MKRTATVLSSLALSVALLGGTATASQADILPEVTHSKDWDSKDRDSKDWDSKDRDSKDREECKEHDSLGLILLGIPLLGFFYPGDC